ncbi:MAG TPA: ATP-binding protein [Bryobacteraceae bacterium]|jgi:anti-sigma regulatory factor (Ser/Thr protein kinase)
MREQIKNRIVTCFENSTDGADEKMAVVNAREAFDGNPLVEVGSAVPNWICLKISPAIELKTQIASFFRSQLEDLPGDLRDNLLLALEELLGNAIEHGCHLDAQRGVELSVIRTARILILHIRDTGSGFSIGKMAHAAVNNPPEDPLRHTKLRSEMGLRPGGYGIMLVKEIADELIYNEAGNEVLLLKYLDSSNGTHS